MFDDQNWQNVCLNIEHESIVFKNTFQKSIGIVGGWKQRSAKLEFEPRQKYQHILT